MPETGPRERDSFCHERTDDAHSWGADEVEPRPVGEAGKWRYLLPWPSGMSRLFTSGKADLRNSVSKSQKGLPDRRGLYVVKHALPAAPIGYGFLNPRLPLVNV